MGGSKRRRGRKGWREEEEFVVRGGGKGEGGVKRVGGGMDERRGQ